MDEKIQIGFAAIDKVIEESIPRLEELEQKGRDFMYYGGDNMYPQYLYDLFNDVTTLKTIIEGIADYVAGDDAKCNMPNFQFEVNRKGMTARELITALARDYCIYGGYAIQIIRNALGNIAELNYLDYRYCRTDKYNEVIYYNEDFNKKWGRQNKTLIYPKYVPENTDIATSVLYVKNTISSTYPIPRYSGAIKACEIERHIDDLHLNSLENGFMGSYVINFSSGIPSDEDKSEIEKNVQEKFCSTKNAGRILLNFSNGKDNAAEVQQLDITDFSEKYKAAAERAREQIYAAFRCNPQLVGIVSAATGFSKIEYQEAYELFYKTVIKPIQRNITDNLDKIFQTKGSITITPFNLEDSNTDVE